MKLPVSWRRLFSPAKKYLIHAPGWTLAEKMELVTELNTQQFIVVIKDVDVQEFET
jgi:hypothetical protein